MQDNKAKPSACGSIHVRLNKSIMEYGVHEYHLLERQLDKALGLQGYIRTSSSKCQDQCEIVYRKSENR